MIKFVFYFLVIAVLFGSVIHFWRQATGKERWRLTKISAYAILCAVLSVSTLAFIYLVF